MATFSQNLPAGDSSRAVLHSLHPNAAHESFIQWLREPNKELRSLTDDHVSNLAHSSSRDKEEDGEIGVFAAEKYFNGDDDDDCSSTRISARVPLKYQNEDYERRKNTEDCLMDIAKLKVCVEPPIVHSDSSSSSQNALVGSTSRLRSQTPSAKVKRRNFLRAFCRCACSDKDSVDVVQDPNHGVGKSPTAICSVEQIKESKLMPFRFCNDLNRPGLDVRDWMRDENHKIHLSYGIDRVVGGMSKENCLSLTDLAGRNVEERKPWKSLGVFEPPYAEKRNHTLVLDRNMTMIPSGLLAPQPFGQTVVSASSGIKDDDSDCSSDLIEIESLSGKVISYFGGHDSGIASGCPTPATYYEPSETSIDWSVVTASAVNMSVMPEHDQELGTQNNNGGSPTELYFRKDNVRNMSWSEWNRQFTSVPLPQPSPTPPQPLSLSGVFGCSNQATMRLAPRLEVNDADGKQPRFSALPVPLFSTSNRLNSVYQDSPKLVSSTERTLLPRSRSPLDSRMLFI